jgi:hypothetical protein
MPSTPAPARVSNWRRRRRCPNDWDDSRRQWRLEVGTVVRHMVRQVVKHGHYKDFLAASKAWNDAAVKVGLPAYRVHASNWGTFNEVFSEAEYEDSGDIERRFEAANAPANTEFIEALGKLVSHLADGEAHDYVLREETLT